MWLCIVADIHIIIFDHFLYHRNINYSTKLDNNTNIIFFKLFKKIKTIGRYVSGGQIIFFMEYSADF